MNILVGTLLPVLVWFITPPEMGVWPAVIAAALGTWFVWARARRAEAADTPPPAPRPLSAEDLRFPAPKGYVDAPELDAITAATQARRHRIARR